MSKRYIIKDWITDGVGLAVWGLAGYLLYCNEIDFTAFCGMFLVGGVLFYVPDEWVTTKLKAWIKQKFGIK